MPTVIIVLSSPSLTRAASTATGGSTLTCRDVLIRGVAHLLDTFDREHTSSPSGHSEPIAILATSSNLSVIASVATSGIKTEASSSSTIGNGPPVVVAPWGEGRAAAAALQQHLAHDLPTTTIPLMNDNSILSTFQMACQLMLDKYQHEPSQFILIIDRPLVELNNIQIAECRLKCYKQRIKVNHLKQCSNISKLLYSI
jgi:hypothetical protein